ncbi:expressed unknown protein [Seminavis robusta]|uniref:MYND-type domain-containing protein n=1 Tax=Seminavis robusta TaxID=568900 RepID=A0A9N8DZQ5_9STRA|nr:expressed unknown protein [Seminavis robusta]|eukprot:Sro477_g150780.1 n/a (471) ;mRNA; r:32685-34097
MSLPPPLGIVYETYMTGADMAKAAGNIDDAMMNYLKAFNVLPQTQDFDQFRHDMMLQISYIGGSTKTSALKEESLLILERLVEDTENQEPIFIRAIASHLLACHYAACHKIPHAHACSKATIQLCNGATSEDRGRTHKIGGTDFSANNVFNDIVEKSEKIRDYSGDTLAGYSKQSSTFLQELVGLGSNPLDVPTSLSEMQPGTAQEWLDLTKSKLQQQGEAFTTPPTLTCKIMETVKALHENDKTFLIFYQGPLESASQTLQDLNTSDEAAQLIRHMDDEWQNKLVYRVFDVDMKRIERGKTHNVFCDVQLVACNAEESHEKNLLSAFAIACLEPRGKPGALTAGDPSRPKKVLFPTTHSTQHPQIRTFMAMMGCEEIDVADLTVLKLLEQQCKTALKVSPFSKKATPRLYDHAAGNQCGKCGIVGPSLLKCSCGKAYYCSKECQKDQWRSHRADHKKAMKKKANKESSK